MYCISMDLLIFPMKHIHTYIITPVILWNSNTEKIKVPRYWRELILLNIIFFITKSTMCNFTWQVVSYLNIYTHYLLIWILDLFQQEFGAPDKKNHESCCVIFEDRINAIKPYDALCISNRNNSEKVYPCKS